MTSTIDISTSVSAADHARVYRSLLDQFETWRNRNNWCTDLYLYVAQLSMVFHWDRYGTAYRGYDGEMKYDPTCLPEDTDEARARDLRELRGRILRFTIDSPDYLTVQLANQFLTTAGLAPWSEAQETPKHRYYVRMTAYIDSELSEDEVMTKLTRSFTRQGLVPGTLGTRHYEETEVTPNSIPVAETVVLLRHPGSH